MKLIICCLCLLFIGCGAVTDKGIEKAKEVCQNNGGIKTVSPNTLGSAACNVYCNNGAKFIIYSDTTIENNP